MTPAQRAVWDAVIERDRGLCPDGSPGYEVAHIIPRGRTSGKRPADWLWIERNMLCVNADWHSLTHTRVGRGKILRYMRDRFHYTYDDEPFRGYL